MPFDGFFPAYSQHRYPSEGHSFCWPLVVISILRVVCANSKMVVLLMEGGVTRSLVRMSMAINSWLRHPFSRVGATVATAHY